MSAPTRLVGMAALLVAVGCGDDARTDDARTDDDAGAARDAGVDAATAAAGAGGGASDGGLIDPTMIGIPPNDSFEAARPLTEGKPLLQDVTHGGESDYFSFEAEAGAFYALSTELGLFSPDTIVDLFDPDMQPLAENDDGTIWVGDTVDSRLVVRAARSGTYFVRVQNHLTSDPQGSILFYHLTLARLDSGAGAAAATLQSGTAAAHMRFATDADTGYAYTTLIGDFASVQRAAFDVESAADQVLVVHVLPIGPEHSGSTASIGLVRVTDDADHALGQIDGRKKQEFVHPPLGAGTYHLTADLVGDAGDNGFFAMDVVMIEDNPREQAEADNDDIDGAENVELAPEMFRHRGLLLSSLDAKDVDYFAFEQPSAGFVTAACEAESGGSGVQGLHAELRDADDAVLAQADETAETNLLIDSVQVTQPGTYYLRLSSATKAGAADVEPWVRCVIIGRP